MASFDLEQPADGARFADDPLEGGDPEMPVVKTFSQAVACMQLRAVEQRTTDRRAPIKRLRFSLLTCVYETAVDKAVLTVLRSREDADRLHEEMCEDVTILDQLPSNGPELCALRQALLIEIHAQLGDVKTISARAACLSDTLQRHLIDSMDLRARRLGTQCVKSLQRLGSGRLLPWSAPSAASR